MAGQPGIQDNNKDDLTLDQRFDEAARLIAECCKTMRECSRDLAELVVLQRSTNGVVVDFLSNLTIEDATKEDLDSLSDIPTDFPMRDELLAAGILYRANIPRSLRSLYTLDGIERKDAHAILHALSQAKELG